MNERRCRVIIKIWALKPDEHANAISHPRGLEEWMSNTSLTNINSLSFPGSTSCACRLDFKQPIKADGDSAATANWVLLDTPQPKVLPVL